MTPSVRDATNYRFFSVMEKRTLESNLAFLQTPPAGWHPEAVRSMIAAHTRLLADRCHSQPITP